jgi:4-aminobutyrate aminotransferase/(S)-3-amino-2-methylpropionate transaminase
MTAKPSEYPTLRGIHVPRGVFQAIPGVIQEARGAVMINSEGKEFIDFCGGIGVLNVGHAHPKVVAAIKDQLEKFTHICFSVAMYAPYIDLAARLNEITPGRFHKKTFLVNSGAEAVENAVKIARYATGRPGIIAMEGAFHGRTLLCMTLTSKIKPYKYKFSSLAPDVYHLPNAYCYRCPHGLKHPGCGCACADYLEEFFISHVAGEQTAAVLAEPVQGEGGFIAPPQEYFAKLQAICQKYGIILIIDEIQSGMGRTGKLYAIEHWGIEPDMITTAKSLAGGLPLSAVTGRAEIMDSVHVNGLGSTFAGNPISCRAALAVLDILLEDDLLTRARDLGLKARARLEALKEKFELVGDVRGKGAMLAMELVKDRETKTPAVEETKELIKRCYERGLIVISCGHYGNVIRTLMPFVITDEQLDRGFSILEESLEAVCSSRVALAK